MILLIGVCMLLGLLTAVFLGFEQKYNASEGTLALLVLEVFFLSIGFTGYGIIKLFL